MNQTTMMHKISEHLQDFDCRFSYFYGDTLANYCAERGYLDFTILGRQFRKQTEEFCAQHNLCMDPGGKGRYDLVLTCSDLIVPANIRNSKVVLVQEGMTDPENFMYHLVKWLHLPRYLASTSTTGLSHAYDLFCVASEGYREHFERKGVSPHKLRVTGIPNFDNAAQYYANDFPHKNYVLAATSDTRETFKFDSRKKFIRQVVEIAAGRQIIFKLHPNEDAARSTREIHEVAPDALVFDKGNTDHMVANCAELVTQYSSVVYVGLALGKKCYSYFDIEELQRMTPIQNGGTSAIQIAAQCRSLLNRESVQHGQFSVA